MYTDETFLMWGKYKFTKLCRVPADYLLQLYEEKNRDKELMKYIKYNMKKIIARKEGKLETPPLGLKYKTIGNNTVVCPDTNKILFISKKVAKAEIRRIQNLENHDKKPIRAYECEKCGGWHMTSLDFEDYEKITENKKSPFEDL